MEKFLGMKDKIYVGLGLIVICSVATICDVSWAKEVTLMVVPGLLAIVRD